MPEDTSNSKQYVLVIVLSIAVIVLAAGLYASVVNRTNGVREFLPEERTLSVSGTSSDLVTPDTAAISIGVIIRSTTAKEASDKNAKVIMISALGKQDLVKKSLLLGAKNYIVKPLDRNKVLERVVTTLKKQ